jgi:hypothetical protein
MRMLMAQARYRIGKNQFAVFYAFEAQKMVGKLPCIASTAFENDHLEAVSMIQVYMGRGQDLAFIALMATQNPPPVAT